MKAYSRICQVTHEPEFTDPLTPAKGACNGTGAVLITGLTR